MYLFLFQSVSLGRITVWAATWYTRAMWWTPLDPLLSRRGERSRQTATNSGIYSNYTFFRCINFVSSLLIIHLCYLLYSLKINYRFSKTYVLKYVPRSPGKFHSVLIHYIYQNGQDILCRFKWHFFIVHWHYLFYAVPGIYILIAVNCGRILMVR